MSLRTWLKEEYKKVIFAIIYASIMTYIGLFVSIILMCIIGGVVIAGCIICFIILEYQTRKEENYKQGL